MIFCVSGCWAESHPVVCGFENRHFTGVYFTLYAGNNPVTRANDMPAPKSMTDDDVPFIPLWCSDGDYILDRKRFNDGFSA